MYREVTMIEVLEVPRLWRAGLPTKRLAAQPGLDPKTACRYLGVAEWVGLRRDGPPATDEEVREVRLALHPAGGRPRGRGWATCAEQHERIARWLAEGVRPTTIRKLLARQGVLLPYPTLYRFAVEELRFGRPAPTMPVLDGEPGQEVQLDTGWVGWLPVSERARSRRRFRAWIFTAVYSRHRFVYPTFEETTARAFEACEAAWQYFEGIFGVLIPDATKAIVVGPDPLAPPITPAFLEYAQARDQLAQVARALYSIPYRHVGHGLTARADAQLVRFYDRGVHIKTHPRQPPGGRSLDPHDYPVERSVYARRKVQALEAQAAAHGERAGRYAAARLDSPLPWTRMRRVHALLGLVRRFRPLRVQQACTVALSLDMLDVRRLQRMLELGHAVPPSAPPARVLPPARDLRPASQYALPLTAPDRPVAQGECA